MKMSFGLCRDSCNQVLAGFLRLVPCLADPARRSSLGLKLVLVTLHLVFAGVLFLFDHGFVEKTKRQPWYTALYVLLFVATLVQYFVTACSSPGYVIDAMRAMYEKNEGVSKGSTTNAKYGSIVITVDGSQSAKSPPEKSVASWSRLVLDLYPAETVVSLHELSIAMTVINAFFSLIIIVFGSEHASAEEITANFG
ncbi:hypothetical protein Tsubulata_015705 [Turnera subulata]|uniref:Uncharacterized protein n=1 Tax=Turnera subulata TaxID=218843 RepID=A0A9Q0J5T8_9ROSI|nr:hypothetical protein Tsubulata_015705 [Turnera subulata]